MKKLFNPKRQIKIEIDLRNWFIWPIYIKKADLPEGIGKITQFTFLCLSLKNVKVNDNKTQK